MFLGPRGNKSESGREKQKFPVFMKILLTQEIIRRDYLAYVQNNLEID